MNIRKIRNFADAVFVIIVCSVISYYAGYLSSNPQPQETCYFSGNCESKEECELYTKIDKIIVDRINKKK